jgi:hypothetical protein
VPPFVKFLNVPDTLLPGSLSMMISLAAASEKPTRTGTVVETAKYSGTRLSARPAPTKVAVSAENALVCDPSKTFQQSVRFGGALTESSARVLAQLSQEQWMDILRCYCDRKEIPSIAFRKPGGALALLVVNPTDQAAGLTLDVVGKSVACKIPARTIQTNFESFC